jgi:hypothetical protein
VLNLFDHLTCFDQWIVRRERVSLLSKSYLKLHVSNQVIFPPSMALGNLLNWVLEEGKWYREKSL